MPNDEPRKPLMAGNWKMNLNHYEANKLVQQLAHSLTEKELSQVEVVVIPPFTDLRSVQTAVDGDKWQIKYGAQDISPYSSGAYTGEISGAMLAKLGCSYAIVGHSERRQYFGETDETVAKRARAALAEGLHVIACIGETEGERDDGETSEVLRRQASVLEHDENLVIAYEPVWAIGTGKTATPEMAQEAHELVKSVLDVPVLYGGSVKPDNAAELLSQGAVDGALVGGASLDVDAFVGICRAASP